MVMKKNNPATAAKASGVAAGSAGTGVFFAGINQFQISAQAGQFLPAAITTLNFEL
jgi:hypothetical protein